MKEEELPLLVDNSAKFQEVEKETQTSTDLTSEDIPDTLVYPRVGDHLFFDGQKFEVTKELSRHRFVVKWRAGRT
jgi:hypothetical protein